MTGKFFCTTVLLVALCCMNAKATTWQTQAPGYWSNANVWIGATIPPCTSNDTFIINHAVIFDQSLVFNTGAYVEINAAGGLCGHKNITVNTGVNILKYGVLELDTMRIPGGNVECKAPGDAIFTYYGTITNNGHLEVNGCSLAVGPWFTCKQPLFDFEVPNSVSNVSSATSLNVTPNPTSGQFDLVGKIAGQSNTIELLDMTGRIAVHQELKGNTGDRQTVDVDLPSGVYFWQVRSENKMIARGKLLLQ